MPDLRERVEDDRGLLKKIQLHIPGFAGYRRREDLRAADNLLRIQLADRLVRVRDSLEKVRAEFTRNYQVAQLEPLGALIFKATELEGRMRHAEQGYSGISATIRVEEKELNHLYEFDLWLLEGINMLMGKSEALRVSAKKDNDAVEAAMTEMRDALSTFEDTFERRMNVITGTEVA
jgi:glutamate-1-semialdehyde aminotransferase